MAASASMGMREIIITAHHEGGFALWPYALRFNMAILQTMHFRSIIL